MCEINEKLHKHKLEDAIKNYEYMFKDGLQSVPDHWISEWKLPNLYDRVKNIKNENINLFSPYDFLIHYHDGGNYAICYEYTGFGDVILSKSQWNDLKEKIDKFYEENDVDNNIEKMFINYIDKARKGE